MTYWIPRVLCCSFLMADRINLPSYIGVWRLLLDLGLRLHAYCWLSLDIFQERMKGVERYTYKHVIQIRPHNTFVKT